MRALLLPLCGKDRAQSAERKRSAPRALRNDARDKFSRPARKCATRKTDEPIEKCAALRAAHLKAAVRLEFAVSIAGRMQGARNARFSPELTVLLGAKASAGFGKASAGFPKGRLATLACSFPYFLHEQEIGPGRLEGAGSPSA